MADALADNLQRLRDAVFARFGPAAGEPPTAEPVPAPVSPVDAEDDRTVVDPFPSRPATEAEAVPRTAARPEMPIGPSGGPKAFPDLRAERPQPEPTRPASRADFFERSSDRFVPAPPGERLEGEEGGARDRKSRDGQDPTRARAGLFRRLLRWIGL